MVNPAASQEYRADTVAIIHNGQIGEQYFITNRESLNGIQLWLRPGAGDINLEDEVEIRVFVVENTPRIIHSTSFSQGQLQKYFPLSIEFPAVDNQPGQMFIVQISAHSSPVQIFGRLEESYPEGNFIVDGKIQDADISFRLTYDYGFESFFEDLMGIFEKWFWFIAAALLFYIPGSVLTTIMLASCNEESMLNIPGVRFTLSISVSLCLIPILLLWCTLLNIDLTQSVVKGYILFFLVVYLVGKIKNFSTSSWRKFFSSPDFLRSAILASLFIITLVLRFAMVRDLAAPAWVDSIHHGMIVRLITETGGYPATYDPYIAMDATYHPGFHALVSFFVLLTNSQIHQAILFVGQLFSALSIFSSFLLAVIFTRKQWIGIFAALATGLFSPFPAYFASWGRYTHLTGLLLLPTAYFLIRSLLNQSPQVLSKRSRLVRRLLELCLCALVIAGLSITHYRVAVFFGLLLIAELISRFVERFLFNSKEHLGLTLITLAQAIVLAVMFSLPWWSVQFLQQAAGFASRARGASQPFQDFYIGYLTTALGEPLLYLAAGGLIWSFARRQKFSITISLWVLLMLSTANLGFLQIPGVGLINNASVIISLYLPISISAGFLLEEIITLIRRITILMLKKTLISLTILFMCYATLVGFQKLLPVLNPVTFLYRYEDDQAMEFINEHIPKDATILINSFLWGYGVYAGNDGGYWITPLTGRKTFPPPVLYGLEGKKLVDDISPLSKTVIDNSKDDAALHQLMLKNDFEYIYIGRRGGPFSAKVLSSSPYFETIYSKDGCWLFRVHEIPEKYTTTEK